MKKLFLITVLLLAFYSCDSELYSYRATIQVERNTGEIDTVYYQANLEKERIIELEVEQISNRSCLSIIIYNDSTKTKSIHKPITCNVKDFTVLDDSQTKLEKIDINF